VGGVGGGGWQRRRARGIHRGRGRVAPAVSVICQAIIERSFAVAAWGPATRLLAIPRARARASARARRNYQKSSKKTEKAISGRAAVVSAILARGH